MKIAVIIFSFLILILVASVSSAKVEMRQHKAHTHGSAKLSIAIEKDTIDAYLDIPGVDLVGFEGPPKTAAHKKNLETVTSLLTKDYNMFLLNEAAGCTVTKRDLRKEINSDVDHSGYKYKIIYTCKDITKITEIELNIFRDMSSLKELTVQLITDKAQKELKLSPTASKITL